jgi:DNA modification methylase
VEKNQLYYGDNLEVLRQHLKDESVDLIYLDPPFNSRQDYNVRFAEKDGTRSSLRKERERLGHPPARTVCTVFHKPKTDLWVYCYS